MVRMPCNLGSVFTSNWRGLLWGACLDAADRSRKGLKVSRTSWVKKASISILLAVALSLSPAFAGGGPRNVLVVINQDSPESREIGQYYLQRRGIPNQNVVNIRCPNAERISGSDFERLVKAPIAVALKKPELRDSIDYIVMTKGTPLRVDYGHCSGDFSSAGVLTCIAHPEILNETINPYGPLAEISWGQPAPVESWRHDIIPGHTFYLVTRLDAYTVRQAKQLVDDAISPFKDGLFVLDKKATASGGYATANERLGVRYASAYNVLVSNGRRAMCEFGDDFISNMSGLSGYFSWSFHDPGYSLKKYTSNNFLPGSIADSYYSYSATTFNEPIDPNRETPLMADLIPQGLSGGAGYVSEPYISTVTYPEILFGRYSAGYNLAESFYAAGPMLHWKTVVFGDPLMAPYATPPVVELLDTNIPLTQLATIRASASHASGINKVEFYFGGKLIGVDTIPPYEVQIDTTRYPVGFHNVEVIAYEDSPVRTQGSANAIMQVVNEVSNISTLAEALPYPDGQKVKITSKVVVAGTDQMGGAFYLEELNRSASLKVVTSALIREGDLVSVSGPIGTVNGERAVINPEQIVVEDVCCPTAQPVFMLARNIGSGEVAYSAHNGRTPVGLRTLGILAKVSGRVTSAGSGFFYLDDKSGAVDGIGGLGIRVKAKGTIPAVGQLVSVVGIPSTDVVGDKIVPVLRMRKSSEIQIYD